MPTYEMRAPNGRTYRIVGPAGATNAQVKAKILAQFPESSKPPRGQRIKEEAAAVLSGIERGMQPLVNAMDYINPLAYVPNLFFNEDKAKKEKQLARQGAIQQQAKPNYFAGGKIAGEIAATAPFVGAAGRIIESGGEMLTPLLSRVGPSVQRIGKFTRTGGLGSGRTAAQTAELTTGQRALQLAERSAGGAINAETTAALTGQDKTEAAAFGAGLPVVGSILGRIGGKIVDLTRLSKVQAGKIIRESLGKNVEAAKAAFRALSPDDQRLAQQVLVEAGVEPSPYFGLGKIAAREIDPDTPQRILDAQELARGTRLGEAAGGSTMEDVRAAVRGDRAAVTDELAPLREEMYQRAGVASQVVPDAKNTALQATKEANDIVAFDELRRMRGVEELGDPDVVSGLRSEAKDIFDEIDSLAAEGMRPMRAADLIASLRQKIADPEILSGSVEEGTIKGVIRQLEKATDANGMLNPKALGKIRRSGINTLVNQMSVRMGGVPSRTGTPEAAQETILELRGLIDDTLRRGGGGDLVDEFLKKSEQGYAAVNRGELAGEALRLYKEDPSGKQLRALVGGDMPKTVGKIMGGGPEGEIFGNAFAGDPRRLGALTMSADELKTLNRMGALASLGETRAGNILKEQQPGKLSRYAGMFVRAKYPALAFAGTGAQGAGSAIVTPGVQREVANSFTSGRNALQAIEQYPTAAQISSYISTLPSPVRNAFAQAMRAYNTQPSSNP